MDVAQQLGGMAMLIVLFVVWVGAVAALSSMQWRRTCVAVFLAPLLVIGGAILYSSPSRQDRAAVAALLDGDAICASELSTVASFYPADSLLIESGFVGTDAIASLLGPQGMKFVEIKAVALPGAITGLEEPIWGVARGSYRFMDVFKMNKGEALARFSLGKRGDPDCLYADAPPLSAPFSPDACIRRRVVPAAAATHAIRTTSSPGHPGLLRWELRDRANGEVLTALTAGAHPELRHLAKGPESAAIDLYHGPLRCSAVEFHLTNAVAAGNWGERPRLAFIEHFVQAQRLPDAVLADNWPTVTASAETIDDWNSPASAHRHHRFWKEDWAKAFDGERRSGHRQVGPDIIDYAAGTINRLNTTYYSGAAGQQYYVATPYGFIVAGGPMPAPQQGLPVVPLHGYDRQGKLAWSVLVRTKDGTAQRDTALDILQIEVSGQDLLIYALNLERQTIKLHISLSEIVAQTRPH